MKKLFFALMAIAAIVLTSCKDEHETTSPEDVIIKCYYSLGMMDDAGRQQVADAQQMIANKFSTIGEAGTEANSRVLKNQTSLNNAVTAAKAACVLIDAELAKMTFTMDHFSVEVKVSGTSSLGSEDVYYKEMGRSGRDIDWKNAKLKGTVDLYFTAEMLQLVDVKVNGNPVTESTYTVQIPECTHNFEDAAFQQSINIQMTAKQEITDKLLVYTPIIKKYAVNIDGYDYVQEETTQPTLSSADNVNKFISAHRNKSRIVEISESVRVPHFFFY